jgi:asparagine synthase (glutamine-hydrolysing)
VIAAPPLEFWEHAERFVWLVGEPFHAPNLMTTHGVRQRIRADGYKVVIVGSGGDEALAGCPQEYAVPFLASLLRGGHGFAFARELAAATPAQRWELARRLVLGARPPAPAHPGIAALVPGEGRLRTRPPTSFDALMRANEGPWKVNHGLRSQDPVHHGIPIESRAPFLDHRVVELAFSLPATYLIRRGYTKYVLRRALEPLLPLPVVWRRRTSHDPFAWRAWIAASKPWILANSLGVELPGVHAGGLAPEYDALAAADPRGLWRLASVLLWHRRCNEGRPLARPIAAAAC